MIKDWKIWHTCHIHVVNGAGVEDTEMPKTWKIRTLCEDVKKTGEEEHHSWSWVTWVCWGWAVVLVRVSLAVWVWRTFSWRCRLSDGFRCKWTLRWPHPGHPLQPETTTTTTYTQYSCKSDVTECLRSLFYLSNDFHTKALGILNDWSFTRRVQHPLSHGTLVSGHRIDEH